jgi:hypothetical protein
MTPVRTAHSAPWKRTPTIAATVVLIALSLAAVGCAVKLIGDYDDTIDRGVSDIQQRAELYFSRLKSTPDTPFDQSVYDDINSRLAVLASRAASLPKYGIISDQVKELRSQFDNFQQIDKLQKRPFPAASVTNAETLITVSVESILKLELALKRGASPPTAR